MNPARTSAWSSAIRMRTVISGVPPPRAREGSRAHACSARPSSGMRARTSKPPPARRPGVQLAAEDAHALAHADEPVAAAAHATGRAGPGPAVADVQLDVLRAIGHVHLGRRGGRVLDGVGDRLLDARGRRRARRPSGSGRRSPSTVERHRQARGPRALDEPVERRRASAPRRAASRLQHAEQALASRRAPRGRCRAMSAAASRARSGSRSRIRRAPPACTTITLIECATTSCISRAIRLRSSTTARSALAARRSLARAAASCSSPARRRAAARRAARPARTPPTRTIGKATSPTVERAADRGGGDDAGDRGCPRRRARRGRPRARRGRRRAPAA